MCDGWSFRHGIQHRDPNLKPTSKVNSKSDNNINFILFYEFLFWKWIKFFDEVKGKMWIYVKYQNDHSIQIRVWASTKQNITSMHILYKSKLISGIAESFFVLFTHNMCCFLLQLLFINSLTKFTIGTYVTMATFTDVWKHTLSMETTSRTYCWK